MQAHRDGVRADRLDVSRRQLYPTTIQRRAAGALHRVHDIGRCHRSEQPSALSGARRQRDLQRRQLGGELLRLTAVADVADLASLADLRDLLLATTRPRNREAARDEEVAAVAVLDLDDVAGATEATDLLSEDELHRSLLSGQCWCRAAAPSRGCSSLRWRRRAGAVSSCPSPDVRGSCRGRR